MQRSIEIITKEELLGVIYVNCLTMHDPGYYALHLLAVNLRTREEKMIDALLPDDRIGTCFAVVRKVLGDDWTLRESKEIESIAQFAGVA